MAINFFSEDVPLPTLKKTLLKTWIKQVAAQFQCKIGDISIVFVDNSYLLKMNKDFLEHDYNTDIITFDYSSVKKNSRFISGDLFISVDAIKTNSEEYNVGFYNELCRVVIHGVLHLLGLKDESDEEFQLMKNKEDDCLKLLQTLS